MQPRRGVVARTRGDDGGGTVAAHAALATFGRAQALHGRHCGARLLGVVGRHGQVVQQVGVVRRIQRRLHQLHGRFVEVAPVQQQQSELVPCDRIARVELDGAFVALLRHAVQRAFTTQPAQVVGHRIEQVQVAIVDVDLERQIEQVVGFRVLARIECLDALGRELARCGGGLAGRDRVVQLQRQRVNRHLLVAAGGAVVMAALHRRAAHQRAAHQCQRPAWPSQDLSTHGPVHP